MRLGVYWRTLLVTTPFYPKLEPITPPFYFKSEIDIPISIFLQASAPEMSGQSDQISLDSASPQPPYGALAPYFTS